MLIYWSYFPHRMLRKLIDFPGWFPAFEKVQFHSGLYEGISCCSNQYRLKMIDCHCHICDYEFDKVDFYCLFWWSFPKKSILGSWRSRGAGEKRWRSGRFGEHGGRWWVWQMSATVRKVRLIDSFTHLRNLLLHPLIGLYFMA